MKKAENSSKSITAVLTGQLVLPLAPENISTIPLYQIHLNLWDTILSGHGEPGLARLIGTENDGRVLKFRITPDVRFSNGRKVVSEDIIFSVLRLMEKQPGGHFNAKSVISDIEALSDTEFKIRLREPTPAFVFLLSIPEMGIVPREACDTQKNIQHLQVTSGAYTVDGVPTAEQIVLKKNPYFTRHDAESPNEIKIHFRRDVDSLVREAQTGGADFFEFYEGNGIAAFEQLKAHQEFKSKITRPSYSMFAIVNPKTVPDRERLGLARLLGDKLHNYYRASQELEKFSYEILPPGTFGSLGLEDHLRLDGTVSNGVLPKTLRIDTPNRKAPLVEAVVKTLSEAGITVKFTEPGSKMVDLSLIGQGMNLDFPEIEFYLSMLSAWAFIPVSDADKTLILRVIHLTDRNERNATLQKIGRDLLENGMIIPLLVRSYAHVYRANRVNVDHVTSYDGDIPFWKMQVTAQ